MSEIIRSLRSERISIRQQLAESGAENERLRGDLEVSGHIVNEWADSATNGLQWLKNVRDGITDIDEAIAEMVKDIDYCKRKARKEPK